jgi:hypothetical protein
MSRNRDWNDEDERPTSRGNPRPHSNIDHTVGQLMVESLNHRRRIEVLEARLENMEASTSNQSSSPPSASIGPSSRQRIFALVRKTVTTTAIIIAALLSALKELGFLK